MVYDHKNNTCKISYSPGENIAYDLTQISCATVVYKALFAGGIFEFVGDINAEVSDGLAKIGRLGGLVAGVITQNVVGRAISPYDIQKYADRLARAKLHIKRSTSRARKARPNATN